MASGASINDVLGLIDLIRHTRSGCEEVGAEFIRIASELQALEIVLASREMGPRDLSDLSEIDPGGTRNRRRLISDCKTLVSKLNGVVIMVSRSQLKQYQQQLDTDEAYTSDKSGHNEIRPQPKPFCYGHAKRLDYAKFPEQIKTDKQNQAFFVDHLACQGHKKCFWLPPIPEKYPRMPVSAGWVRVETSFGRLFWRHKSGLVSYEHPHKTLNIKYSPEGYHFNVKVKGSYSYQSWRKVDKKNLILDDAEIAFQMTKEAWDEEWLRWNVKAKPKPAEDGTYRYNYR
ncbi:MAG: hypothetical protein Q9212_006513 [Teloschistes hypoglaucus]